MWITVQEWKKYNPRSDVKHPSWFRLENNLFDHPKLSQLNHVERSAMLYIFCQVSKANNPTVEIELPHVEQFAKMEEHEFRTSVEKLKTFRIVTVSDTCPFALDTDTSPTDGRTDERTGSEQTDLLGHATPLKKRAAPSKPISPKNLENLFEIVGKEFLDELHELYPDEKYLTNESRKLFMYFRDNPKKNLKTPAGWRRTIQSWMGRGWDRYVNGLPVNKRRAMNGSGAHV